MVLGVTGADSTSGNVARRSDTHKCVWAGALSIALLFLAVAIGKGEEGAPQVLKLLRLLNTPKAALIVLGIVLVIDGLLFCLHELPTVNVTAPRPPLLAINPLAAVEGSSLSPSEQANETQQEALAATLVLIALLIIGVINVVITYSAMRSARNAARLGEISASYASKDLQSLVEEEQSIETQHQVYELKEEVQRLRQEYKQLAEELARVWTLQQQSERERERIIEGLQKIQLILVQRKDATTSKERGEQA